MYIIINAEGYVVDTANTYEEYVEKLQKAVEEAAA